MMLNTSNDHQMKGDFLQALFTDPTIQEQFRTSSIPTSDNPHHTLKALGKKLLSKESSLSPNQRAKLLNIHATALKVLNIAEQRATANAALAQRDTSTHTLDAALTEIITHDPDFPRDTPPETQSDYLLTHYLQELVLHPTITMHPTSEDSASAIERQIEIFNATTKETLTTALHAYLRTQKIDDAPRTPGDENLLTLRIINAIERSENDPRLPGYEHSVKQRLIASMKKLFPSLDPEHLTQQVELACAGHYTSKTAEPIPPTNLPIEAMLRILHARFATRDKRLLQPRSWSLDSDGNKNKGDKETREILIRATEETKKRIVKILSAAQTPENKATLENLQQKVQQSTDSDIRNILEDAIEALDQQPEAQSALLRELDRLQHSTPVHYHLRHSSEDQATALDALFSKLIQDLYHSASEGSEQAHGTPDHVAETMFLKIVDEHFKGKRWKEIAPQTQQQILRECMQTSPLSEYLQQRMRDISFFESKLGHTHPAVIELRRHEAASEDRSVTLNIVSNCEDAAHLLAADFLQFIFENDNTISGHRARPAVPLFETKDALEKNIAIFKPYLAHRIAMVLTDIYTHLSAAEQKPFLETLLNTKPARISDTNELYSVLYNKALNLEAHPEFQATLQTPALKPFLEALPFTIFVGYSDSERENGLSALGSIRAAIETILKETFGYNIKLKIFHGAGGDLNRGGTATIFAEQTIQGEHVAHAFATPEMTHQWLEKAAVAHLQETRRTNALRKGEPPFTPDKRFQGPSQHAFHRLYQPKNIEGGLHDWMSLTLAPIEWIVRSLCNSGSRGATRADKVVANSDRLAAYKGKAVRPFAVLTVSQLRAITNTQLHEMLGLETHIWAGTKEGLEAMDQRTLTSSPLMMDILKKTAIGLARTDFKAMRQLLFADLLSELNLDERTKKRWLAPEQRDLEAETKLTIPTNKEAIHAAQKALFDPTIATSYRLSLLEPLRHVLAQVEQNHKAGCNTLLACFQGLSTSHQPKPTREDIEADPCRLLFLWPKLEEQTRETLENIKPHRETLITATRFLMQQMRGNTGKGLEALYGEHTNETLESATTGLMACRAMRSAYTHPEITLERKPSTHLETIAAPSTLRARL